MKDELFLRGAKVPMTKEVVRTVALARLALHQARHFIDVGAGTGSVSIEAALSHPELRVTAIERNPDALTLLAENRRHFDCCNIEIIAGEAPVMLGEKAEAIFIGGSGGNLTELIDWALEQLNPQGRLVLTFILQENLTTALDHLSSRGMHDFDCLQLQISELTALGCGHYFKPNNPTFMISCQKEKNHG
ncbi:MULTISPECIES: decarboxylating cobalt-precorrin-6B (C(15))-methyltransferase [Buttiauxella]|jgi:cobalt-precorrin-6B (C15)-methyltransferase|uniref:decarboxylating cobalt-precorrin-6B (C(15))-methyltransferase n=1 Tax=Buttiauxella TaxID=82976 RepID=UPI000EF7E231|nr:MULTISPECIES: decarboxylating cobalt-precorrin-6B (C(15))-methyltransferase [unclassified Buttiauxella]AYN29213.1 decarboxylating cobalt-precorrin-6B (C(15))-methyltransferase [Buttiauxella sp. 3AFRM03]